MGGTKAGDRIDRRYEVLAPLGHGGMGEVYRVRDRLGGVVALKRVLDRVELTGGRHDLSTVQRYAEDAIPEITRTAIVTKAAAVAAPASPFGGTEWSPASVSPAPHRGSNKWRLMLMREFSVLASLRHPHIISVVDYGFDQDLQPYYTMEILEDAQTIVEAGQDRPIETKIALVSELLQALIYLHRRGVVHRDLKPSNVLVADGHVKVLDFGIAIHAGESSPLPAGTLAYMAPEIVLGVHPSPASDLYAVGLIAYELVKGHHPFDLEASIAPAIQALSRPIDYEGVDGALRSFLERLLAPDATKRCRSAAEALDALRTATGARVEVETQATRESFLQAAMLVGREVELTDLQETLARASTGAGGGVLVAGASGVGKSRLIDELRVQALVTGVIVLKGEEVSAGGGPYQVWLEVLRRLVLVVPPTPDEAAVLKPLVPEIADLLDQPVADAPALDPEVMQSRILTVVDALFRRVSKPAMVLLDDVQWSGSESIKLLARISREASRLPLLVVAAYREDEAASLKGALPDMRVVKIRPLDVGATAALTVSMLGDRGHDPDLLAFLLREAEGIPFFLVEVVRALAEEAGELGKVGVSSLPSSVVSGGMQRLIRRRLDRVPAGAAALLRAAAVLGRRIDPALLRRIDPAADMEPWFAACAEVGVVEIHDGSWRFSHDKLREGVLGRLTDEESRTTHRSAAEAIEAEYPGAPQRYRALALHWEAAGVASKAIDYLEKAGEQALADFSNREAIACFEKAVALDDARGRMAPPIRRGMWARGLAAANLFTGEQTAGIQHAKVALGHFGHPMPASRGGCVLGILQEIPLRVLHAYRPPKKETSPEKQAFLREATATYSNLVQHFFLRGEAAEGALSGLRALHLGEMTEPTGPLAYAYGFMSIVAGMGKLNGVAERWAARAVEIAEQLGGGPTLGYCLARTSCYFIGCGKWPKADAQLQRGLEIAKKWGDHRCEEETYAIQYMGYVHFGSVAQALAVVEAEERSAAARGDAQILNWARTHRIDCAGRLVASGNHAALGAALLPWLEGAAGDGEAMYAYGAMGVAALVAGDRETAQKYADQALIRIKRSPPSAFFVLNGVAGAAHVYLSLIEANAPGRRVLVENATAVTSALETFMRLVPIAEPVALRSRGRLLWSRGDTRGALEKWRRSLAAAQRMGMKFEEAETRALLGRFGDAQERAAHEVRSAALFEESGVPSDRSGPATTRTPRRTRDAA